MPGLGLGVLAAGGRELFGEQGGAVVVEYVLVEPATSCSCCLQVTGSCMPAG